MTSGRWGRLDWLPIPLFLAAIIAARMAGLNGSYESHTLLLFLSFTFYTLVSLGTLYLIGRSFLSSGSLGLLMLECGVVFWSLAGTVGDFVSQGDANINVTIFNTGIMLAGLCYLTGTILTLGQLRALHAKCRWLGAGIAFSLGALWLVAQAALLGWLPVFFIPGHGGTPVRYFVLISAIATFALSAGLLLSNQRAKYPSFIYWYALALLMMAVGLFGVMIQLSLGSVVNWLSRAAQWLGGAYLLAAAFESLRESQIPLIPRVNESHPAYYRDAIALTIVIGAAAIRLTFLQALDTQAPYLLFYPAVIFAAMYGGLRPGILATALSAILADYFWIEPVGSFVMSKTSTWLSSAIFMLSGAMITWLANAVRIARARAYAAETQSLLAAEREVAMKELQESESREKARAAELQAFLDAVPGIVFIANDPEGRNMTGTRATNEFLRLPAQANLSKSASDSEKPVTFRAMKDGVEIPPEELPVQQAARGSEIRDYELDIVFSDGVVRTILGNATPVPDDHDNPRGAIGVFIDITGHKQAEKTIRDRERLLQDVIDCSTSPIFLKDVDGRFIIINTALESMLGMSRKEIKGKTDYDIASKGVADYWRTHDKKVMETGKAIQIEEVADLRDGLHIFLANKFPLVDVNGQVYGVGAISHDITDRKLAEAEKEKLITELEAALKELDSFTYSVSHDLRAPLRAIDGFSRMLLTDIGEKLDPESMRKFNVIRNNAEKMAQLIDGLLGLSRTGRASLSQTRIEMNLLVKDVWEELLAGNRDRDVELIINDLPSAFGDRVLVRQVLSNLLSNAIKFTSKRDHAVIEVSGSVSDGFSTYCVKDNGAGFDMRYYDKLFGVFRRLHGEKEFEGTGVGLAIVNKIIQKHGGRIWAESNPDEGATFYFTLPVVIGTH